MQWRLIIEEYGPELEYIKGTHNIIADALTRLDIEKQPPADVENNAESFGQDNKDIKYGFPFTYRTIEKLQKEDPTILALSQLPNPDVKLKDF